MSSCKQEIDYWCIVLRDVPDLGLEFVNTVFELCANTAKHFDSIRKDVLAAACLFIGLRHAECGRYFCEIAEVSGIDKNQINNAKKKIEKVYPFLKTTFLEKDFEFAMIRFCRRMGLPIEHFDSAVLLAKGLKEGLDSGAHDFVICGVTLYIVFNLTAAPDKELITKICNALHVKSAKIEEIYCKSYPKLQAILNDIPNLGPASKLPEVYQQN